mgnify:CR=1 FL=1
MKTSSYLLRNCVAHAMRTFEQWGMRLLVTKMVRTSKLSKTMLVATLMTWLQNMGMTAMFKRCFMKGSKIGFKSLKVRNMQEYDPLMEARRIVKRLLDAGISVRIPGSGSKFTVKLLEDCLEEAYHDGSITHLLKG